MALRAMSESRLDPRELEIGRRNQALRWGVYGKRSSEQIANGAAMRGLVGKVVGQIGTFIKVAD
jgi:hypothetical protein